MDPSWRPLIEEALQSLDPEYLQFLESDKTFFPDKENFLNAFKTLSLQDTQYILFGQDPYPRKESATGYAFIDGKVGTIFNQNGLSKEVNRATSLRNFMKMALFCEGVLQGDFSKEAVAKVDTSGYIQTINQLRENFEKNGVLLLNTALVFTTKEESKKHLKAWQGFVDRLLQLLQSHDIVLILFGSAAKDIKKYKSADTFEKYLLPHPYNIGFITESKAHQLFKPMRLLSL
ncbi:MAG: uracil-DNA glycosylase [Epsilonproteobacteria bacterium]|nr:uracil-DNA glycosylase [Campylobacterota bacterium]